ncbi:glycosyltransferase family A protein [Massilia sp. CF038]|uniref:glycosyltransferase family A protein n=1 Tax=Massilia sp. CF038 TaxID=1881045 RepID=UPI000913594D|nr:glycosyltransferase family 2 protein [Massilia sp. CF038]SHH67433.1 Glycosyl transferase family 2 [Massilia sp. CF038]
MSPQHALDILIPTRNRDAALAVTLTALSAQDFRDFRIIVSDQSDMPGTFANPEIRAVLRYLAARGLRVLTLSHLPRLGMAEQRAFLLSHARAPACLFLDDDVILETDLVGRLHRALQLQRCGFVGSALHGLSYVGDHRPEQQYIEFWDAEVAPERLDPSSPGWSRHHLHSAANLYHVQSRLALEGAATRPYKVAWVGGCVMFDTQKLRAAGGFDFWRDLPAAHCGEDVLAQLRVMEQFGGCGIVPSGAYHMELPTTISERQVDAPKVLHR